MSDHTDTLRGLYDAFAKGDVPTVLAAMAPDITWTEAEGFRTRARTSGPMPCCRACS